MVILFIELPDNILYCGCILLEIEIQLYPDRTFWPYCHAPLLIHICVFGVELVVHRWMAAVELAESQQLQRS